MTDKRYATESVAGFRLRGDRAVILLLCVALLGCQGLSISSEAGVGFNLDLSGAATAHIDTFSVGENHPAIDRFVGPVYGYSCRASRADAPATKADALVALKLEALDLGANAVVDVAYAPRDGRIDGSDCLEIVAVAGNAVILAD